MLGKGYGRSVYVTRKNRFAISCFDENNRTLIPNCFVQVGCKPAIPQFKTIIDKDNNVETIKFPGEFDFTQYFINYGGPEGESKKQFDAMSHLVNDAKYVSLCVYDGYGNRIAKWEFVNTKITLLPETVIKDKNEIIAKWHIQYEDCNYVKSKVEYT